MPFDPHPRRGEYDERVAAGEKPIDAAKALGIHASTARLWERKRHEAARPPHVIIEDNEEEDATEVRAPQEGKTINPKPTPARGGSRRIKVITEATAEKLCEGMFLMAAVMSREPEWLLDDTERKALGGPLADTLASIPAPIAQAVNAYAAPTVFMTTLFGVITAKQNRIRAKNVAPKRPPADDSTTVASGQPEPSSNGHATIQHDMDLNDAIAAAKGKLQADDEPSDGERNFTG